MKIALYILLALVVLVGGAVCWFYLSFTSAAVDELVVPPAATKTQRIDLIDNYLAELHKDRNFNGGILFAEKGEPLLMKTYGYTDHTGDTELTTQSSFRLASVSKQFTAAGILRATELGLLELDEPIISYIKSQYSGVTVRHLLNQTSGIPDEYMNLGESHRDSIGEVMSNSDVINLMYEFGSARTGKPGDAFEYSNTNYALLAGIIEAVSGKSFEDFMQAEFFEPLGMVNSRVFLLGSPDTIFVNKTRGFVSVLGQREPIDPDFLEGVGGDGNVFASIEDFLHWDQFWNGNNDIVSDSLLQQAFLKPTLNDGSISTYGFGWVLEKNRHWHNGSWLAARTMVIRNPKSETILVLLDNSTNFKLDGIVTEIGKALKPPATEAGS